LSGQEAGRPPAGQPPTDPLIDRLRAVRATHLNHRRRAALRIFLSFIVTFGLIRLLTYAIHRNLGPFHDIAIGGGANGSIHVHHYMWGIFLVCICGLLALSLEAARWHPVLAVPFGVGLALILDEFALLLQLKDVYWAAQGRVSVDIGLLTAAGLGVYCAGPSFWHAVVRELNPVWLRSKRDPARGMRGDGNHAP